MTVRIVILMILGSILSGSAHAWYGPGGAAVTTVPNSPTVAEAFKPAHADPGDWEVPDSAQEWDYAGDLLVKKGLAGATAKITGLTRLEVEQALDSGKSIAQIARAEGQPVMAVLSLYDKRIQRVFDAAIQLGQLTKSMADGQAAWYKAAARQMIDQPRLKPSYPGLHQLHGTLISASMRVTGMKRSVIRTGLMECRTLEEILAEHGQTGQMAVDSAIQGLAEQMDALVSSGKLSQALRTSWESSLKAALEKMVATPGVHVAGRHCAH